MHNSHKQRLRPFVICFLLVILIFLALYKPFIFDGRMYTYTDIGSDTTYQYLPFYVQETEILRNGDGDGYKLQAGLGRYVSGLLTKYLNPGNIAVLLFGAEKLHVGILVATWLQYVMICGFSLLYFLQLLKNEKASVISALIWTFCGYNILWGQHYLFLTAMVGFSASMYGFQLYLDEDKKQWLVIPLMSLLLGFSYYFTYISAGFLVVYGLLYLIFQRKKPIFILKKVGIFVLLVLVTACISASYLVPSAVEFWESRRTGELKNVLFSDSMFYPAFWILSFGARFLSSNLLGIATFTGPTNYYETAILSVSILFVFSVAYLLLGKKRWHTLGILLGCSLLLCLRITTRLLCFSDGQRWTYLLNFLQALAIGFALKEYFEVNVDNQKRAGVAILLGDGFLILIVAVLINYHYRIGGGWLNKNACMIVAVIVCLYHIAFLLLWKSSRKFVILLGLIAVELFLANYATINHRSTVTVEQWYTQMYNDGTQNVVDWIQEQDDSIYRINKTYDSVYMTDSLVQGYNGMGYYYSTNSGHLLNLANNWGYNAGNMIQFMGTDWLINDMMGVKYLITKSGTVPSLGKLEQIYDDGTYSVYKNADWSGFGYLAYEEMSEKSIFDITREQQALLLTKNYYYTGSDKADVAEATGSKELELLPNLMTVQNCQVTETETGLLVSETGTDAQLYFSIPEFEGWDVACIEAEMDVQVPSIAQFFVETKENTFCEEKSCVISYGEGRVSCLVSSPDDQPITVRFDPTTVEGQRILLHSLKLILIDFDQLQQQQLWQQENTVTDLRQVDNTFTGAITNPAEKEAMLCIPLIYSDSWKAEVDGEPVETFNINGGLVGIRIPPNTHKFELTYDDTIYKMGKIVSWGGIAIYVVGVVWWINRQRRKIEKH